MKTYALIGTLFLLALSGYCLAQSDAPSLGDVARQNRGAKKKATVVLNDENGHFPRSAPSSSTTSAAPQVVAASNLTVQPSAKTDTGGKSAKSAEAKDAPGSMSEKQKLDYYKSELDSWKTITKRDEDLLANEKVPFRQQMYQDALEGDRQTTTFFQGKVDELQSELSKSQKNDSSSSGGK